MEMIGKKFGKLTSLSINEEYSIQHNTTYFNCICDCGKTCISSIGRLKNKNTKIKSCGCEKGKIIDLVGQKFNRLTVLRMHSNRKHVIYWETICDCGKYKFVSGLNLKSGAVKSCGCLRKEMVSRLSLNDLKNKIFGRLLVIERIRIKHIKSKAAIWKCKCNCGNYVNIFGYNLQNGNSKSCGCYNDDIVRMRFQHPTFQRHVAMNRQVKWMKKQGQFVDV
jgi:hypothetical protein